MRLSEQQKEILKTIGMCMVLAGALIAPNIIQILKPFIDKKKYYYKRSLNTLVKHNIIYLSGEEVYLTEKGETLLKKIHFEEIKIMPTKKWNGIWHLVCYDIPEKKKKERDYFRAKLINFGFRLIQDSLWVIPYECKEEIAIMSQNLGISPNVAYLNTDYLPQQEKLIKYYNLIESIEPIGK